MNQSQVILTIEAVTEGAAKALKHPHNARRYIAPTSNTVPEDRVRQVTPEKDVETSTNSKVVLTFDQPLKDRPHFVFGSDLEKCDVYIGPQAERVSGRH